MECFLCRFNKYGVFQTFKKEDKRKNLNAQNIYIDLGAWLVALLNSAVVYHASEYFAPLTLRNKTFCENCSQFFPKPAPVTFGGNVAFGTQTRQLSGLATH